MANEFHFKLIGDADVKNVEQAIQRIKTSANAIDLTKSFDKQLSTILKNLSENQIKFKTTLDSTLNKDTFDEAIKQGTRVVDQYTNLIARLESLSQKSNKELTEFLPQDLRDTIKECTNAFKDYDKAVKDSTATLSKSGKTIEQLQEELNEVQSQKAAKQKSFLDPIALANIGIELGEVKKQLKEVKEASNEAVSSDQYKTAQAEIARLTQSLENLRNHEALQYFRDAETKSGGLWTPVEQEEIDAQIQAQQEIVNAYEERINKITELSKKEQDLIDQQKQNSALNADIEDLIKKEKKLTEAINKQTTAAIEEENQLKKLKKVLAEATGIEELKNAEVTIDQLRDAYKKFETDGIGGVRTAIQNLLNTIQKEKEHFDGLKEKITESKQEYEQFEKALKGSEELKNKVKQFFTAANAIQLFRRAINNAFSTIKELDAIMTETAVVTNFDVGDMWSKLPEYTDRANKLGVAISDTYKAATLYYQQGLKTNEVVGVSNQTLKMARIAGLDAAEATNKMTAALRGFNMEVTEANATRVSDVYSKLAAITASDVQEISSAMTKTASLASNAGMQFETTAAFLSQIIETTRESAETAGTALKTVIARFQELKKSPDEIGEVDGEVVDANKIESALKSVGVALRDASGQFRDLDSVFLELASKWDTLDKNTQRYIATIAAGSRQQSRFIAMMSDYKRTQQLVAAANNSAGAANQQYEKTLESLDAKLKQLKNAYDEFTLSIADSDFIKKAVDTVTDLISKLNELTAWLPKPLNGFAKLGMALGIFKTAGKWFNSFSIEVKKNGVGAIEALSTASKYTFNEIFKDVKKVFSKKTWNYDPITESRKAFALFNETAEAAVEDGFLEQYKALARGMDLVTQATERGIGEQEAHLLLTLSENEAIELLNKLQAEEDVIKKEGMLLDVIRNKQTEVGLLTKTKWILQMIFGNELLKEEAKNNLIATGGIWKKILADKAAAKAQAGLNASMYACPAFWLASAIAALVGVVIALAVALDKAAEETRLKKFKEAIQELEEGISEIKEKMDGIVSAQEKMQELSSGLNSYTEGTKEWRQQLVYLNAEVLSLLEKYPELRSFTKVGDFGQFYIEDEGWDEVLSKQTNALKQLTVAQAGLNLSEIDRKFYESDEFQSAFKPLQQQYLEAANGEEGIESRIANYIGLLLDNNIEGAKNAKESIENYVKVHKENEPIWNDFLKKFDEQLTDSFSTRASVEITSILTNSMSEAIEKSEFQNTILDAFSTISNEVSDDINEKSKAAEDDSFTTEENARIYAEIHNLRDINGNLDTDAARAAIRKDRGTAARQIEYYKYGQQQAENMDKALAQLSQLPKEQQELFKKLANYGESLTLEDLSKIALLPRNIEGFSAEYIDQISTAISASFQKIQELLGSDVQLNNMTAQQARLLGTQLHNIIISNSSQGTQQASIMASYINNIVDSLGEDGNIFLQALNAIDWKDSTAWDNLRDDLVEMGVSNLNSEFDDFIEQAKKITQAIQKVDLKKFETDLENLLPILNKIKTGEQNRTFDKSTAEALTSNYKDLEFVVDLDGNYQYIGAMEDLTIALEKLVAALPSAKTQLDTKVTAGNILQNDKYSSLLNATMREQETAPLIRHLLRNFIQEMTWAGKDVNNLGVNGLTKETDIEHLTSSELEYIIQQLNTYVGINYDDNLKAYNKLVRSDATRVAMDSRVTQNAASTFNRFDQEAIEDAVLAQAVQEEVSIHEITKIRDEMKELEVTGQESTEVYAKLRQQYSDYLHTIANTTAIRKANKALQQQFTTIKELIEQYDNTKDSKTRFSLGQQIASILGIDGTQLESGKSAEFITAAADMLQGYEQGFVQLFQVALRQNLTDFQSEAWTTVQEAQQWLDENIVKNEELQTLIGNWADQKKWIVSEARGGDEYFRLYDNNMLEDAAERAGSKRERDWENPYTWLYNMNERINGQIRERDKLERQYQRTLENRKGHAMELIELSKRELDNLRQQQSYERTRQQNAAKEIRDLQEKYSEFSDPARNLYTYDAQTGVIRVNQDEADKLDAYSGNAFEKYISRLEELRDVIDDSEKELDDINKQVKEIRLRGRDQYVEMENKIRDALIWYYTEQIDELEKIGTTISDTNSKLISSIQESVSKSRQDRKNQETEQALSDKQRRLAYLQMDTSGANATEILKLQDELAKDQQSYTDTLVDQAIDEMEKANQIAQEQREQQISIMRSQLDYARDAGLLWEKVHSLFDTDVKLNGDIKEGSWLGNLLRGADGWAAMSEDQREIWNQDIQPTLKEAKIWAGKELYDYIVANPIPAIEAVLPQDFYDNLPGNSGGFEDDMGSWHDEWTKWAGVKEAPPPSNQSDVQISLMFKEFRNILMPIIYEKPIAHVGVVHLEMGLWMMEEMYLMYGSS